MDDSPSTEPDAPLTDNAASLGPEELGAMFGWDTAVRVWATGVQVFPSSDSFLLVFKEQIEFRGSEGVGGQISRNVASIVMPADAAKGIRELLVRLIPDE